MDQATINQNGNQKIGEAFSEARPKRKRRSSLYTLLRIAPESVKPDLVYLVTGITGVSPEAVKKQITQPGDYVIVRFLEALTAEAKQSLSVQRVK